MDYGSRTLQKIMSDTSPNYLRQGIFSLGSSGSRVGHFRG
jgi:hypothetical protein